MNTELNQDDTQFIARTKELLEHSVEGLDPTTTRRLQRARMEALDARPVHNRWPIWAGGLAMAAVAAFSLSLWLTQPAPELHHPALLDDFDLVTSSENVELADDFEFYHWLADADTTG